MADGELDIRYVAELARLELTAEEETQLSEQLGDILGYVAKLGELDVSTVEPMSHAVPLQNVVREDEPRPSLSHEEVMQNAPAQAQGLFLVPKIVE